MFPFVKLFGLKCVSLIFAVIFAAVFNLTVFGADEIDSTFNPAVTKDVTSNVTGNLTLQPDGKILIFGVFQSGGTYLNRLNTDGSVDTSFNCAVCNTINVYSALALADGKIIVTGFTDVPKVYRLNFDGSLDSSFNANITSGLTFTSDIEVIAAQPDGKIFVRQRSSWQGYGLQEILRYNTDGSRDTSFTTIGYGPARFSQASYSRVLVLPNGKLLVSGTISNGPSSSGFITRHNSDGTRDLSFESPTFTNSDNQSFVGHFDVYPDGKILVPGRFTTVNSVSKTDVVRLFPAGNVDLSFTPDPVFAPLDTYGGKALVLPDGKFLVSTIVYSSVFPVSSDNRLYRFNSNGTLDNTFNPPAQLTRILNWTLDSSSRVLVFGVLSGNTKYLRLNADGSLDTSFNPVLIKRGIVTELAVQTDGKILIVGDFNRVNGTLKNNFARVNSDGSLDPTFDSGSGFDVAPRTIALQTDGKILAIGDFTLYNGTAKTRIVRLNSDGSLDSSFNPEFDSSVLSIFPLANGKILVGGSFTTVNGTYQSRLARLNSDGSLDISFNPVFGSGSVSSVFVQSDGKIMVGGSFSGVNGFNRQNLVRLNTDGSLDAGFNAGSISPVNEVIQQPNGKYLLLQNATISRRNNDGSADANFQTITINGTVSAIFLQSDGKILVGGTFTLPKQNFARFLSNGALDSTFFPTGANNSVYAIVGQPDGKVLVGGNFITIGNVPRSGIARIIIGVFQSKTIFDYDADGRADVSVFRASENKWYIFKSSDSTIIQQIFGVAGDVPVPADYDGDGKTDYAVFRPASGDWWYSSSINNQQVFTHWGQSGDIPRPSDFDGDGKADYVLFRPSNSIWYRISSATGTASSKGFGLSGDKPVVGDFDGDGKSDVAIYRPSTGTWWYQSSINNAQIATQFGISSDVPTAADFDGDGKTDFAVYRASSGTWYILNSSNGQAAIINFGIAEDKPVAADYDGDGKADIAVFRPSTGIWYLLRSTAGFTALNFGVSSDVPTPNSFVP